jgi:hypothetical protein
MEFAAASGLLLDDPANEMLLDPGQTVGGDTTDGAEKIDRCAESGTK